MSVVSPKLLKYINFYHCGITIFFDTSDYLYGNYLSQFPVPAL